MSAIFECGAQSYSVDKKQKKRPHIHISLRKIFIGDKQARVVRKTERKDAKKRKKSDRLDQKAAKRYQKTRNKPDYMHTDKDAYKKMKKTKRQQKRLFKNKERDPWVKRIFQKKHKTDKVKRDRKDREKVRDPILKRIFRNNKRRRKH